MRRTFRAANISAGSQAAIAFESLLAEQAYFTVQWWSRLPGGFKYFGWATDGTNWVPLVLSQADAGQREGGTKGHLGTKIP